MNCGGTSVGDCGLHPRTAQIIAKAAKEAAHRRGFRDERGYNRLIEAAKKAQEGNTGEAAAVVDALRKQHEPR